MAELPLQISKPKLLIGEGREEVRFFGALLNHLSLGDIQIEQYNGKSALAAYLRNLPKRPSFRTLQSLGITRDADDNAVSAFQSVQSALNNAGLDVPNVAGEFVGAPIRMAAFILPDGQSPGMLEDVCLAAIRKYPELSCLDSYFQCVLDTAQRRPANASKARVHAWLSSQIEPDKRLGEAAEIGYWPWDDLAFDPLKRFLRAL